MKHFVVCGNMGEYQHYLKVNGLDTHLCAYVSSFDTLSGARNPKGIFTGTWWNRKDIIDIIHTLLAQGANITAMGNAIDCYYRKIGELYHD